MFYCINFIKKWHIFSIQIFCAPILCPETETYTLVMADI